MTTGAITAVSVIITISVGSILWLLWMLVTAEPGFQDETGFHEGEE